ncbi:SDR family oxidoreductase [Neogemmobacter tilapiae]|uniref:NAD(P)-dependent oxidoreductase n=1 Tax=Neogemmobacter tilapiae TaxID=875041 RepID=A0A918WKT8_9RHOB|nr:SDR family oxidoreductase [Gemmobacter tilapiae]GHC60647.1 NAD(P)-dependent oxidoreductase [Gemmobacter tilapiae]
MTIGVTGATGQLGRLAVAALKAKGADVVALVRDTGKAADLGVAARVFDYKAADAAALAGIETLVLISSNDFDDRAGQHKKVIAAAKTAGVKRVVYTSLLKGDASPMILAGDHIATEAALKDSGLTYTILRNGWYLENHTGNLGGAIGAGAMIGSSGEGRISAASRQDYAEAIAAVAGAGHENKVYELAGDDSFTVAEMATVVSQVTGKTIPFNNLPEDTYAGILQSFGLPEGFAKILADSDVQASKGALFDDSKTLSRLIGRPTTKMADAVKAALS